MVNLSPPPHKFHDKGTNIMGDCPRGNNTIWQTFPVKEYHMANLPRKKTQIPYVIISRQHGRNPIDGERNPIDGELLPYGILSRGRKSMGGVPCDTGFAFFWQHDVSQKIKSIPYNYNQPYISRNMSTCVVTSQLAHNQRLQVSG